MENTNRKKEILLKSWKLATTILKYIGRQSGRATAFLYNRYIPEKVRESKTMSRTGSTLRFTGHALKSAWHLAACESTKTGEHHFSPRRVLASAIIGTSLFTAANVGYVYGTTDTYQDVVVTARDVAAKNDYQIAGKIYTKDADGNITINKRFFTVAPTILRPALWHSENVFKDIPSDGLCNFKTYGIYWYSMITQGVMHRPHIYQADCHAMTYEDKLHAQEAQSKANDNESRMEKFTWGYFDRDYGIFPNRPPVPAPQTTNVPTLPVVGGR